jgi:hypothetical protein
VWARAHEMGGLRTTIGPTKRRSADATAASRYAVSALVHQSSLRDQLSTGYLDSSESRSPLKGTLDRDKCRLHHWRKRVRKTKVQRS